MSDTLHRLRKVGSTLRIMARVFRYRTFGQYRHTLWDGNASFAVYIIRGKALYIPTTVEDAEPRP